MNWKERAKGRQLAENPPVAVLKPKAVKPKAEKPKVEETVETE